MIYQPGKGSLIRTNTRSLQNYVGPTPGKTEDAADAGTTLFSWLAPKAPRSSRVMALKVIPSASIASDPSAPSSGQAVKTARHICGDLKRAIIGGIHDDSQPGSELVEEGDIISLEEAKKRTGYLEQIGHSIRKLVWA